MYKMKTANRFTNPSRAMKKLFEILSQLSSITLCVLFCLVFYEAYHKNVNHPPVRPQPEELDPEVLLPPAPPILNPPLKEPPEHDFLDQLLEHFTGPCHPILTAFKAAYDIQNIRPLVMDDLPEVHAGPLDMAQVGDVFDHFLFWKPFDDPAGKDMVTPASTVWRNPAGDCDEYACALSAALYSIGAVTRVTFAENPRLGGHAFTEVCLGRADREAVELYLRARYHLPDNAPIYMREDERGYLYLNLDWSAKHPGGRYFDGIRGAVYYPSEGYCETF